MPRFIVFLFLLAALDSALAGAWVLAWPASLFSFLATPPNQDGVFLFRALGVLLLAHVPLLLLAAFSPDRYRALILVPLIGRILLVGMWLWLLGFISSESPRVQLSPSSLTYLLSHDAVVVLVLGVGVAIRRR